MDHGKEYWFSLALYDLETAHVMLTSGRLLYVGFMCHQAVEKLLKGIFVAKKCEQPPFTHNLMVLVQKAGIEAQLSEAQLDLFDTLDPLNIEARYPTYKDRLFKQLTQDFCKIILEKTQEVVICLRAM